MFNIGFSEFLVIGVIALLVIGPKQLPEVARVVGRLLSEIKNATQELSGGLLDVTREVKSSIDDTKSQIVKEGRKIVDDVTRIEEGPETLKDNDEVGEVEFEYPEVDHVEDEPLLSEIEQEHSSEPQDDLEAPQKEKVDGEKG